MGRRIDDEPKPGYLPILFFTLTTRMGIVNQVKSHYFTMRTSWKQGDFFMPFFNLLHST